MVSCSFFTNFKSVAEAVLITGGIGVLYDRFLRIRFEDEMAVVVNKAVNADVTFLKEKMSAGIDSIIKNCIHAKLCNEERALALYEGLISPYTTIEGFRKKFEYEIKLDQ